MSNNMVAADSKRIDWMITLVPFILIMALAVYLFVFPEQANGVISQVRFFFGDTVGLYYLVIGVGVLLVSIFLSFSKYGDIVLGEPDEKPQYNFFTWGSMMFTCGLAADILFYSFAEWVMYATNPHIAEMGSIAEWAGVFPLFHWSFIPWAFYLVLAVAFGFMLHVRKRSRQRYSEACKPVIGEKNANGLLGRVIDLFALFALLAGTATTFSVATPLMASIIVKLFNISISRTAVTIIILLITCAVYTYAVLHGFKGISFLAKLCIYLFFGLLLFVLVVGGQGRFIVENGFQSLGKMFQHFIELSTYTDPARTNNFPQDWTIYYSADFIAQYQESGDLYQLILNIVDTMPASSFILALTMLCMIAFYATSFDSIAYTAACYSYKSLEENEKPHTMITLLWCILLIVLPIALVFSESSMSNIQSVSIISAFPIGIIMIIMIWSFLKDAKAYMEEIKAKDRA